MKKLLTILLTLILSVTTIGMVACDNKYNDFAKVKYFSSASDMIPMLKNGELSVGLLPEPAATQLTKVASDKTWYRLDLQELYDGESKAYPQAIILVKQSLLNTYPDLVNNMAQGFNDSVQWVKENTEIAVNAVNARLEEGVTPSLKASNITAEVVDGCKIYWQNASDAKEDVKDYINDIMNIEPSSAKKVEDDFFYDVGCVGAFSKETVSVIAPDGAPALAISKYISDGENFGTGKEFNYKVVSSSKIGSAVQTGAGDIVIIPVNAASKLYTANTTDTYKLVSVITHGNLYIMSTEKIENVKQLKDKVIGVIGQGLVPDLTFRAVLDNNKMGVEIAN